MEPRPKTGFGPSAMDPGGGAYDAPPDSYSAGEGTPAAEIPISFLPRRLRCLDLEGASVLRPQSAPPLRSSGFLDTPILLGRRRPE